MSPLSSSSAPPDTPKHAPTNETEDTLRIRWDGDLLDRFGAAGAADGGVATGRSSLTDRDDVHAPIADDDDTKFKGALLTLAGWIGGCLWYGFLKDASATFIAILIALGLVGVAIYGTRRVWVVWRGAREGTKRRGRGRS